MFVKQTPYALGYVEFQYAVENDLTFGEVKNRAGRWILPDIETIKASVPEFSKLPGEPEKLAESLLNPTDKDAYPISSFTFLVFPRRMDIRSARITAEFVRWALTEGQLFTTSLGYVPLPQHLAQQELEDFKAQVETLSSVAGVLP